MGSLSHPTVVAPRFDVRVMQSGRMKGQAFVGLPTEEAGERAVAETNGFMLKGKPMVVVSGGRSHLHDI